MPKGGSVAVLEFYEAQRRIRDLAGPPTHIIMDPTVLAKMVQLRLDLAGLRIALRKCQVQSADGERSHRRYKTVGKVDDLELGTEVSVINRGEVGEVLKLWDIWKA